jgi:hypothetical protein
MFRVVEGEKLARTEFDSLIRQLNTQSSLKQVDRNVRIDVVFAPLAVSPH